MELVLSVAAIFIYVGALLVSYLSYKANSVSQLRDLRLQIQIERNNALTLAKSQRHNIANWEIAAKGLFVAGDALTSEIKAEIEENAAKSIGNAEDLLHELEKSETDFSDKSAIELESSLASLRGIHSRLSDTADELTKTAEIFEKRAQHLKIHKAT